MTTIEKSVRDAGTELPELVEQVVSGQVQICLVSGGKPKALIVPYPKHVPAWRADGPADPSRYGDLDSPVLEEWS